MKTREEIYQEILEIVTFKDLKKLANECSWWNGSLEYLRIYNFDEYFFDSHFDNKMEIARAVYFGDINNWNDDYIRFNGYGNLESFSTYKYDEMLKDNKDNIVNTALELYENNCIDITNSRLEDLFNKYIETNS